jgi:hypothetical protein
MGDKAPASALLTQWEVSYQRANREIEWDILLKPLLFGPVCVLDNMLIDNQGLIDAIQNRQLRALLAEYARAGLVRLWHRDVYGDGHPVRDIEDLLMIWLSRDDPQEVRTVGLFCLETNEEKRNTSRRRASENLLSGYNNQQLRELIKGFGTKATKQERVAEFKDFMVKHGPSGFLTALEAYQDIFFNNPNGREQWSKKPTTLQARVLRSFGIKNPDPLIERCAGNGARLAESLAKSETYPPRYNDLHWREFLYAAQRENSPEERFFANLAQKPDVGWISLWKSATDVRSIDLSISRYLPQLVTEAYVCGIPEANGHRVMWDYLRSPYIYERNEAADIIERKRVLDGISQESDRLIKSALEFSSKIPSLDSQCLRKHLHLLVKVLELQAAVPSKRLQDRLDMITGIPLTVMVLLTQGIVDGLQSHLLLALLEIGARPMLRMATEKVVGAIYPIIPGIGSILGIHDGSIYRRGMKMIKTLHVKPL